MPKSSPLSKDVPGRGEQHLTGFGRRTVERNLTNRGVEPFLQPADDTRGGKIFAFGREGDLPGAKQRQVKRIHDGLMVGREDGSPNGRNIGAPINGGAVIHP